MGNEAFSINQIQQVTAMAKQLGGAANLIALATALASTSSAPAVVQAAAAKTAARVSSNRSAAKRTTAKSEKKPTGERKTRASRTEVEQLKTRVFEQAQKLGAEFSASEVASQLGQDRADVSRMLGKLCSEGKLQMNGTRKNARYQVAA